VADGLIGCWRHGSRFDLTTGELTGPTATRPVPAYPIQVADGALFKSSSQLRHAAPSRPREEEPSWPLHTTYAYTNGHLRLAPHRRTDRSHRPTSTGCCCGRWPSGQRRCWP
jgi:hypothetical protein